VSLCHAAGRSAHRSLIASGELFLKQKIAFNYLGDPALLGALLVATVGWV